MLRRHKNKKGQNTAEYAILIALVVAAIVAMQTYAQRALQAKVRDASVYMAKETGKDSGAITDDGTAWKLTTKAQYEPYYSTSNYTTDRDSSDATILDVNTVNKDVRDVAKRKVGGNQKSDYNAFKFGLNADNF